MFLVLHFYMKCSNTNTNFINRLQEFLWPYLFAMIIVPSTLQIGVLPFLPESPRFLLLEKNDTKAAEKGTVTFIFISIDPIVHLV